MTRDQRLAQAQREYKRLYEWAQAPVGDPPRTPAIDALRREHAPPPTPEPTWRRRAKVIAAAALTAVIAVGYLATGRLVPTAGREEG